jgi:thiamine biosynthesis lipoprotein
MTLHRFPFRAMAAEHELQVAGTDRATAARAAAAAIADVHRIEAKYSRYTADSVTTAINRSAGGPAVAIDDETRALLRYADQCWRISDGAFDVTSGVLRRAWRFDARPPRLPSATDVEAVRALIGWQRVELGERAVRLPIAGMEIDFGGIGKEYAADRAATILASHGVAHALVNLGGDVRALGGQPDGRPWRIGIVHPRTPGAVTGEVDIVDGAIATSGDYQRFIEVDGKRYAHILDPRTGWPVSYWQSASVVAPVCTLAGSLATIAMLRPDAPAFLDAQGMRYLLVDEKGRRVAPAGLATIS